LRRFYRWLLSLGRITADPTLNISAPPRPPRFPKTLSEYQVEHLLAAPDITTELGLRDAPAASLAGIRAGFFAYPYVGVASASRGGKPWPRALRVFSVVPRRDHLASIRRHMRALASVVSGGGEVEVWSVDATHAFDEPGLKGRVLAYDENLGVEALQRFQGFLRSADRA
jgi:hypothetical protein